MMVLWREIRFHLGSARHAHRLHDEIKSLRRQVEGLRERESLAFSNESAKPGSQTGRASQGNPEKGVAPENLIWIFGTARTGSTWLARMLHDLPKFALWNEPLLGNLFGDVEGSRWKIIRERRDFVFTSYNESRPYEVVRQLVLITAGRRFPSIRRNMHIVVKEPHGSHGSSVLMEAVPESRMILLVRDPRDVVASGLDAHKPGGWAAQYKSKAENERNWQTNVRAQTRQRSQMYMRDVTASLQSFQTHEGRKVRVSYEDLRQDTGAVMLDIVRSLSLPVEEESVFESVRKHDWENVPQDQKGSGKGKRKATPGSWREDLTPEQIEIVEEITAPLMHRLGYERVSS